MSFFNSFLVVKEDRTQLCLQVSWLDTIISWLKVPDFTSVSRSNAPGDMLLSHFELVLKFRVATPLLLEEANHCEAMVITYGWGGGNRRIVLLGIWLDRSII